MIATKRAMATAARVADNKEGKGGKGNGNREKVAGEEEGNGKGGKSKGSSNEEGKGEGGDNGTFKKRSAIIYG